MEHGFVCAGFWCARNAAAAVDDDDYDAAAAEINFTATETGADECFSFSLLLLLEWFSLLLLCLV